MSPEATPERPGTVPDEYEYERSRELLQTLAGFQANEDLALAQRTRREGCGRGAVSGSERADGEG